MLSRIRRSTLLLACLFIISLNAPHPAVGAPGALVGVGEITAYPDCPRAFKIPLTAVNVSGNIWTFAIAGIHVGCVVTWGVPMAFQGTWNPATGGTWNSSTGTGCPTSVDLTRTGHLCLGAVPDELGLHQTTLNFCINTSCWSGIAFIERASTTPSAQPGTVSGAVEVTAPGCNEGAYKFPITAVSDGGPVWLVVRPAAIGLHCPAIYYSGLDIFAGNWNPDTGGCIQGDNAPNKTLCIGPVPNKFVKTTTTASLCAAPEPCWSGTATVVRT